MAVMVEVAVAIIIVSVRALISIMSSTVQNNVGNHHHNGRAPTRYGKSVGGGYVQRKETISQTRFPNT